jgi:hypothetical protein
MFIYYCFFVEILYEILGSHVDLWIFGVPYCQSLGAMAPSQEPLMDPLNFALWETVPWQLEDLQPMFLDLEILWISWNIVTFREISCHIMKYRVMSWSIAPYHETSHQFISTYRDISRNIIIHISWSIMLSQSIISYHEISYQHISTFFLWNIMTKPWISWHVMKEPVISWNTMTYHEVSRDIKIYHVKRKWQCHEISWQIMKCNVYYHVMLEISQTIMTSRHIMNTAWHIMKYHDVKKTSWHVIEYHNMSWNIKTYHDIVWHIISYHAISWTIMNQYNISWNIKIYHDIFWNIMSYHEISWHIMNYDELSSYHEL